MQAGNPPEAGDDVTCIGHLHIESHDQADGTVVLTVRGEADIESAPDLQAAVAEAATRNPPTIVLDLAALEFIDSTGISVLVRAQLSATEDGRRLLLRNVPDQVNRVLTVAGLGSRFTISPATGTLASPPSL